MKTICFDTRRKNPCSPSHVPKTSSLHSSARPRNCLRTASEIYQQICCALGSGLEDSKIDKTYAFVSGFLRITAVKTSKTQFSAVASFELPQPRQKSRFFGLQLSNSRKSDFRQWLPSNYSRQNIKIAAFLQPSKRQKHSFRQ